MTQRAFVGMGMLVFAVALVSLAIVYVAGGTPSGGKGLRTPWGAPDLQGIWSQQTDTPFERPAQYGQREFLTEAELAARNTELGARPAHNTYRDTRKQRGTEQDVAGAYNAVFQADRPNKSGRRTSQIVDPPDGRIPALTSDAKSRQAAMKTYLDDLLQGSSGGRPGAPLADKSATHPPIYNLERMNRADGPEDRAGGERCFGAVMPAIGALQRIVQSPDSVEIFYDIGQGGGFSRVIPITGMPHLPSSVRQFYGDARGRWEGDTLVVDVTNFTNRSEFRGSRENLHLVERYTRSDAGTLAYQVTVEDPTTWTRPWTAIVELNREDGKANLVFEQTCHEGNYGLLGMLANTRAAEKLFKAGQGPDPNRMDLATGGGGDN
jgi:hypothetical protein